MGERSEPPVDLPVLACYNMYSSHDNLDGHLMTVSKREMWGREDERGKLEGGSLGRGGAAGSGAIFVRYVYPLHVGYDILSCQSGREGNARLCSR